MTFAPEKECVACQGCCHRDIKRTYLFIS